jgi:hypothetical protein
MQQQDDLGLGIVFRIPVGERLDRPSVGRAEAAGAIGHIDPAAQQPQHLAQHPRSELAHERLAIAGPLEKSRADDEVEVLIQQMLHQPHDFARPMLAVAVHLHGDVVPAERREAVARLHGRPDAGVEGKRDDAGGLGHVRGGVVDRAVVDDDNVELRQSPVKLAADLGDGRRLIEGRHDRQVLQARRKLMFTSGQHRHGHPPMDADAPRMLHEMTGKQKPTGRRRSRDYVRQRCARKCRINNIGARGLVRGWANLLSCRSDLAAPSIG